MSSTLIPVKVPDRAIRLTRVRTCSARCARLRPTRMNSQLPISTKQLMAQQLCSREIRWLANGTQLQMRQSPLPSLDKHQRDAKLPRDTIAAIGCVLGLTTSQD